MEERRNAGIPLARLPRYHQVVTEGHASGTEPFGQRRPYSYRADPGVPSFADDKPVIVFDADCVLCSNFARFVLGHDPLGRYRLLAAQSPLGMALYRHLGLDDRAFESNLLLAEGRAWLKSEGSIRMFEGLGFPWMLAGAARILPRVWRDAAYDVIARNRLRWFGRRDACFVPDPAHADRFLA